MQEPELSPLAQKTVSHVVHSLQSHDAVPAINQILEVIRDLSSKAESLQIAVLAEAITKDLSLSAKVLMAANTMHFNHHGTKVTTITEAIQRIGLKQIRNLAVTLLLIGPLQDESQKSELKQITSVALMSGLASQLIAQKAGFPSPEQALICSSMRHYGRILVMNFLLDEYRYVVKLAETCTLDEAYKQVLGLGVMELGLRVAEELNLAPVILRCMEPVNVELLKNPPDDEEEQLQVLSEFSMQLCELIEDGPQDTTVFNEKLAELARRFEPCLKVTYTSVDQLIRQTQGELDRFQALYRLKPLNSPFINRIHAVTKRSGYTVLESKSIEPDLSMSPEELFIKGLEELTEVISGERVNLPEVYKAVVRTLHLGLRLKNTLLLFRRKGEQQFEIKEGIGQNLYEYKLEFRLALNSRDVFSACAARGDDVLLQDLREPKITAHLPDWHKTLSHAGTVVILPIKEQEHVIGVIYGEKDEPGSIELNSDIVRHLKALRNQIRIARRFSGM